MARTSPVDTALRTVAGSSERYNVYHATNPPRPFVGVTSGWLERSQLLSASTTGLRQRFVTVILHTQEWERTVGFLSTATGFSQLHAQLARDALQFSSRAQASNVSSPTGEDEPAFVL